MTRVLLVGLLILAGCSSAVTMRHPVTGATAHCGPYVGTSREAQCIQDYKEQGFVRVPS